MVVWKSQMKQQFPQLHRESFTSQVVAKKKALLAQENTIQGNNEGG